MEQHDEAIEAGTAPVVLRPVANGWTRWWVVMCLGITVVVGVLALVARSTVFLPTLIMGPGFLLQHLLTTVSRVEVDRDGMVVHRLLGSKDVRWADVDEMTIDPPGGPRLVRYRIGRDDRFLSSELADDGGFAVLDAYRSARRRADRPS